jgi:pimeloyl-ACP methyl ester carboxylesterase/DNA-binding SARP family transcriptional activator
MLFRLRSYPALSIDGVDRPLQLRRGWALLAVLAEEGKRVSRLRLVALLWPDASLETGRARLRRLVHEVNSALDRTLVVGDDECLRFSVERQDPISDVEHVRRAAHQLLDAGSGGLDGDAFRIILAQDSHTMLQGFDFGSDAFAGWVSTRRTQLERLIARTLRDVGTRCLIDGQSQLAADAALRLTGIEPLSDAGHSLLLRAHAMRGDLAAFEASYCAYADLLRLELGVQPSPSFESEYQRLSESLKSKSTFEYASHAVSSPSVRFADAQHGVVGYFELGSGPVTILIVFGIWSHIEVAWEEPTIRSVLRRLAQRARVVLMDRRGVGVSERLAADQSLLSGVADIEAVRTALGSQKVWLIGSSLGSMVALEYAALHKQSVEGLILYGGHAKGSWAPDYPWAPSIAQLKAWGDRMRANWNAADNLAKFAPTQAGDPVARTWWARLLRQSTSPGGLTQAIEAFAHMDVRARLPDIDVPTLILHRQGDRIVSLGAAKYLAHHIRSASLKILEGQDHNLWAGDVNSVIAEIERFLPAEPRMG